MYIIKNALRCIGRSKGRNVLISIITLVIAVSACIGLSIRQAAESAKKDTLEELNITAAISYDRSSSNNDYSMSMFGKSQDPANQIYMSSAALQTLLDASDEVSVTVTDQNTGRESDSAITGSVSATYVFENTEKYYAFEEEVRNLGLDDSYTVSSPDLTAFEKGLALKTDIESNISVEGNSTQLKQIVSILLDNAIRHSKEQSEVYLSLKREHSLAKLSVINKGDEIPQEPREQIFERFYRADTARNSEDNRYGLGLAIAKAIAVSHKGKIEVQCYNGFVEFKVQIPAL